MYWGELTPPCHPKHLSSAHLGGAIVVRGGVECHVLWIRRKGSGHHMVQPLFQEGPSGGQVGVRGRHRMDGWVVCSHFMESNGNRPSSGFPARHALDFLFRHIVVERRHRVTSSCSRPGSYLVAYQAVALTFLCEFYPPIMRETCALRSHSNLSVGTSESVGVVRSECISRERFCLLTATRIVQE